MRKQAESEFAAMCAHYHIWAHKWRDVSRCPNCGKPLFMTERNKSGESIVDYLAFIGDLPIWVECKGGTNTDRFDFAELKEHQRRFMTSWDERRVGTWLFLLLGKQAAPHRRAWLIPWSLYVVVENMQLTTMGKKSFSIDDMIYFDRSELIWGAHAKGGGWILPETNVFAVLYPQVFDLPELY